VIFDFFQLGTIDVSSSESVWLPVFFWHLVPFEDLVERPKTAQENVIFIQTAISYAGICGYIFDGLHACP
jgi:hypothetical protein